MDGIGPENCEQDLEARVFPGIGMSFSDDGNEGGVVCVSDVIASMALYRENACTYTVQTS